ncbi:MAG: hypothetical protein V1495_10830 [Pseudomonadota bacterium]
MRMNGAKILLLILFASGAAWAQVEPPVPVWTHETITARMDELIRLIPEFENRAREEGERLVKVDANPGGPGNDELKRKHLEYRKIFEKFYGSDYAKYEGKYPKGPNPFVHLRVLDVFSSELQFAILHNPISKVEKLLIQLADWPPLTEESRRILDTQRVLSFVEAEMLGRLYDLLARIKTPDAYEAIAKGIEKESLRFVDGGSVAEHAREILLRDYSESKMIAIDRVIPLIDGAKELHEKVASLKDRSFKSRSDAFFEEARKRKLAVDDGRGVEVERAQKIVIAEGNIGHTDPLWIPEATPSRIFDFLELAVEYGIPVKNYFRMESYHSISTWVWSAQSGEKGVNLLDYLNANLLPVEALDPEYGFKASAEAAFEATVREMPGAKTVGRFGQLREAEGEDGKKLSPSERYQRRGIEAIRDRVAIWIVEARAKIRP